ncbi:NACHT, LRR and PYD domains-containing protein 3-like isoform X1 [Salminus brasiliensis]|uniref:NACHT, LRR and PYD domains-containing protein 3-like isoform X1 n=1 Tax=Salminus brasiliensis TaxID=930266 RepID=UPI003B82FC4A
MLSGVSESWPELLLACLVIVLSILLWRMRHLTRTKDSQVIEEPYRTTPIIENRPNPGHPGVFPPSVKANPSPTPVVSSDSWSVVVSASTGSTVNAPAFNSNNFHGPSVFNITTTSGYGSTGAEPEEIHSADDSILKKFLESHKASIKKKTQCIFEGKKDAKNKTLLKNVYTQLYITEGELNKVNNEHETLKIMKDKAFRGHQSQETAIHCNEIFSVAWKNKDQNKTVLTKGIAGIGKTVSVQKFLLDWAEGEANQHIDCMFLLPFRELNLLKDKQYSFHELLVEFHPDLEELKETKMLDRLKLVFIFDGLDESRLSLNFDSMVRNVKKKAPVDSLVTNLINGNLLPTARLWITSRPAAANQIPLEYVDLFTEIRGFTDKQKEEYFRKRIPDETEASRIITHIKISQSLYIMCHIPVFCWITATVLQEILIKKQEDVPSTLTEMYIHFLLIQMNMKNQKYDKEVERDLTKLVNSNRVMILKLAKLAFEQLKKENIMFYENDLRDCGIDASEDSEYSGMCAEIFKQESVLYEKKVYCFIHLSLQEFLAAFYVFYTYLNKDMEDLQFFFGDQFPKKFLLEHLLTKAFDKAMESEKGHLDLFLRFLLGISHESNHKHLTCLLPQTENTKKSISKVIQHIKQLQNTSENLNLSPEKSINNFFCLLELKDSSLYNQIMKYMNVEALPDKSLSLSNCSALAYILVVSEELLDELNPKKYNTSNAACRRLVPAVRCCKKALFAGCELTMSCCECVSMALQSENSPLRELDLSDNYGLETATTLLSDGLKSSHCKLEILRLARCNFSQKSCAELVSALRSTAPNLKELDLSSNDLQDSGLNQLLFGLGNLNCKLQILRLGWCNLTEKSCKFLSSFLNTTSESCLTELDLSDNDLQNAGIELLSAGLENPKCRLEILRLSGCMITEEGCSSLASALSLNPSYLKELDLSYNHPGESGEKLLSARQEDPLCHFLLRIDPKGEQFIKAGMKKYACRLTLDPNTAHKKLYLSEANRRVTFTNEIQDYPDHPDRFETFPQVLCKEGLSARCYWEVKCEEKPEIGVTYPQIQRKEEGITVYDAQAQIGLNVVSWILGSSPIGYHACHASEYTNINTTVPESGRIGVFLDWPAGILSFYSISTDTQTVSHLHTFHTTFKNHLFPAFFVDFGSVSICQID